MNKLKTLLLLATVLIISTGSFAQSKKHAATKKKAPIALHKVVMQLSSADTLEHKALLNNLKNLKEGWGDSVKIEVVIHGPGIDLVTKGKTTQQDQVQTMVEKGVHFVLCRNTMKQRNITEEQIIPNIGFVPMGVGEVIMKQEQGWSYLKAGF